MTGLKGVALLLGMGAGLLGQGGAQGLSVPVPRAPLQAGQAAPRSVAAVVPIATSPVSGPGASSLGMQRASQSGHPFLAFAGHPTVRRTVDQVVPGVPMRLSAALVQEINAETLGLIQSRKLNPVRAARALALTLVTVNDAAAIVQTSGRALNADAVAARAAHRVQRYLFPQDSAALDAALVRRLAALPTDTATSSAAVGQVVADCVLLFARADHADRPASTRVLPEGTDKWAGLIGQKALEVNWGWVTPIALTPQALPQVTPPPRWNDPAFAQDRAQFVQTQRSLTDADRTLAVYWAAGAGTVTPAGMWLETAARLSARDGLDGPQTAWVLATTALSAHNAFIACWRGKFQYNVARPQNWLPAQAPDWKPVIATPPFPSYPSGHATVSSAAAAVLGAMFPQDSASLSQQAQDAARSRVVGGIHWTVDGAAGLDLGSRVARTLLATLP